MKQRAAASISFGDLRAVHHLSLEPTTVGMRAQRCHTNLQCPIKLDTKRPMLDQLRELAVRSASSTLVASTSRRGLSARRRAYNCGKMGSRAHFVGFWVWGNGVGTVTAKMSRCRLYPFGSGFDFRDEEWARDPIFLQLYACLWAGVELRRRAALRPVHCDGTASAER